ncbi:hypothetical protein DR64_6598 [Paraburkholderia xenovorans LB400]|jgi:hypothetical protein|uniref:Uncharacterized protein n=1 Tax=Paraburkholderia xenovorans (strain LB400) TaxID=266265 RepID=Q13ML6_PARXL|nr:hypothetical protein [Paraburkholderia xenovorans]ABE34673.1 hypothetical protein Bxe_B1286 [Paraburkholderia xenovorans LB400]AIP37984.1 hypothetical protein DR64_6598 [Paraburkholderia xenovorans LB400]
MMEHHALAALKESIAGSNRIAKIIFDNFEAREMQEIRLNLICLTYDFALGKVLLQYYAKDGDYPDVEVSFSEMNALVCS